MKRGGPLKRDPQKTREWRERSKPLQRGGPLKRSAPKKRSRSISPASKAQRDKVRGAVSIVSGKGGCDPAHLWPRGKGGCDDALCTVPLTRTEHRLFDEGKLDLTPYLTKTHTAEVQHALGHAEGSLTRLLHRLSGQRWVPEGEA